MTEEEFANSQNMANFSSLKETNPKIYQKNFQFSF